MEGSLLIILVLLVTNSIQGLEATTSQDEKSMVKNQLHLINKPSIKSFMTKHGDIVDCVDINKQFAFDHPLLQNHSIQVCLLFAIYFDYHYWSIKAMKPNFMVSEQTTSTRRSSTTLTPSQVLPKHMRCPRGSVPIRRIQEEDLAMQKFSPLFGMKFSTTNFTKSVSLNANDLLPGHQIATLVVATKNLGANGVINVWNPEVTQDQLTVASVFVASDDVSGVNGVSAGWVVNPSVFGQNNTRFYAYWTKDSGKNTGCYDGLCPGFVQVSQKVTPGLALQPVSTYQGEQRFINISIKQELKTKNWWLFFGDEGVGYWPKELFGTLGDGATRAGWGGEIYTSPKEAAPGMGSGHFPEEGPNKACVIYGLSLVGTEKPPAEEDLKMGVSKPDCYKVKYGGDSGGQFGHFMLFGGPPNCKSIT
ncbi:uncharacterized protein LOC110702262 [Chenopodium quinoa]|uniref:uncharacterized protein LOC110702262 n=1 Tax=Chenopodium quinoa TaxID=63459 RepID=UPI000B792C73|nr:uncharacterized protein LOC110702262 [Chenopodium quinoa]